MFRAIVINKNNDTSAAAVESVDEADLPDGEVSVDIDYSTLNYKDGLAITGKAPVVRNFPMVAGIDFAGTVTASNSSRFKAGDKVILNGWGVGESHWGGLSQKARVKADWLVSLPEALSTFDAMACGTAGYTAMLCVQALEAQGVKPEDGEIVVTGASGGVGSVAVFLLANRGYRVVALTGRMQEADYLRSLGASEVMDRSEFSEKGRPLARERWAGAVDVAGSHTLANVCASTKYLGTVTCCGLAQGMDFPASVAPFILRGVKLIGIDSVQCPAPIREKAWAALATEWKPDLLKSVTSITTLDKAINDAARLLNGEIRGRLVVDVNKA
ncbi:MAG: alcohol dehydrogenase [unclassified Hahellaceae]|nr:alcohol dehydrogenase [Hahellaceae bacterium]|tara:strand:- start:29205 stop:30191 length:987 start_codon:yes stop_codon:yes gene_type:complete